MKDSCYRVKLLREIKIYGTEDRDRDKKRKIKIKRGIRLFPKEVHHLDHPG